MPWWRGAGASWCRAPSRRSEAICDGGQPNLRRTQELSVIQGVAEDQTGTLIECRSRGLRAPATKEAPENIDVFRGFRFRISGLFSRDQHIVNTDARTQTRDRPVLTVRGRERGAVATHRWVAADPWDAILSKRCRSPGHRRALPIATRLLSVGRKLACAHGSTASRGWGRATRRAAAKRRSGEAEWRADGLATPRPISSGADPRIYVSIRRRPQAMRPGPVAVRPSSAMVGARAAGSAAARRCGRGRRRARPGGRRR